MQKMFRRFPHYLRPYYRNWKDQQKINAAIERQQVASKKKKIKKQKPIYSKDNSVKKDNKN
jgi:hypothetical protein